VLKKAFLNHFLTKTVYRRPRHEKEAVQLQQFAIIRSHVQVAQSQRDELSNRAILGGGGGFSPTFTGKNRQKFAKIRIFTRTQSISWQRNSFGYVHYDEVWDLLYGHISSLHRYNNQRDP